MDLSNHQSTQNACIWEKTTHPVMGRTYKLHTKVLIQKPLLKSNTVQLGASSHSCSTCLKFSTKTKPAHFNWESFLICMLVIALPTILMWRRQQTSKITLGMGLIGLTYLWIYERLKSHIGGDQSAYHSLQNSSCLLMHDLEHQTQSPGWKPYIVTFAVVWHMENYDLAWRKPQQMFWSTS